MAGVEGRLEGELDPVEHYELGKDLYCVRWKPRECLDQAVT